VATGSLSGGASVTWTSGSLLLPPHPTRTPASSQTAVQDATVIRNDV
jgi:hypothetical protein